MEIIKTNSITPVPARKGRDGWEASQIVTNSNGDQFQIRTSKGRKCVSSSCTPVDKQETRNGFTATTFCFDSMMKSKTIATTDGRATENNVNSCHSQAIRAFAADSADLPAAPKRKAFEIGQKLYFKGYGHSQRMSVIISVDGDRLETYTPESKGFDSVSVHSLREESESVGISYFWRENDSPFCDPEELDKFLHNWRQEAEAAQKAADEEAAKKAEAAAKARAATKATIPADLLRKAAARTWKTGAAHAAYLIKGLLKIKFPAVQFSVKSDSFSMGDSVDVCWIDGPTDKAVNDLIGMFQYGSFNGMEDMYEMTNRQDFPQTKYLSTSRRYSIAAIEEARDAADLHFKVEASWNDDGSGSYDSRYADDEKLKTFRELLNVDRTPEAPKAKEAVQAGNVRLIEYGKGFAFVGDTYSRKDGIKAIGCRFCRRLTVDGEKVAGWVLKKAQYDSALELLESWKAPNDAPDMFDIILTSSPGHYQIIAYKDSEEVGRCSSTDSQTYDLNQSDPHLAYVSLLHAWETAQA